MKIQKRILTVAMCLLLLACTVLPIFSCAKPENTTKKPTQQSELTHLEGLDFDGALINFIVASADGDHFNKLSIDIDEDTGDSVETAIFTRNEKVEAMLNVEIVIAKEADATVSSQAKSALLGGSEDYDVLCARQYDDIQLALDGVVLNLNTLASEYDADYIKWDNEYWGSSYIDALSFNDKVYWLAGDLCLRYMGGYYAFFVNTRLYNNLLEKTYGSIYNVVKDYKWTYDMLIEMLNAGCYEDTNGNEKVDITAGDSDRLSLALPVWDNANGMAISAGVQFTTYDENGVPSVNINTKNATLCSFMEKFYQLLQVDGIHNYGGAYKEAMALFASGNAVFVAGRLNQAELYLSQMEDDYYVIPCPMLNEEQHEYVTGIHDAINIYGISIHSLNIPAAAATLEAMAAGSYYDVRPIYYDSVLKFKYTRDSEAAAMIDIMHDGVYTDFVFIWQFSSSMKELGMYLRQNVATKNYASGLKKKKDVWTSGLESILESIEAMED